MTVEYQIANDRYEIFIHGPGGQNISVPSHFNFLDVHLGQLTTDYQVSGLSTYPEQASSSTFVFLPAGQKREIQTYRSGWSLQVMFEPSELERELEGMQICPKSSGKTFLKRPIYHQEDVALVGLAHTFFGLCQSRSSGPSEHQINAATHLIVSRTACYLAASANQAKANGKTISTQIQNVLKHIEENLCEPLPLEELASLANLSMYHFARVFRSEMNISPHRYVVERRAAHARNQLSQTNEPIARIAYDCGFSSQSHMTVTFKRIYGTTPGNLRKNH